MLADLTPGMSGAQIANVVNEAALLAARVKSDLVKLEHFENAIERVMAGNKKTTNANKHHHKQILASMEAGKCLASWLLPSQDSVIKASIVPSWDFKNSIFAFSKKKNRNDKKSVQGYSPTSTKSTFIMTKQ